MSMATTYADKAGRVPPGLIRYVVMRICAGIGVLFVVSIFIFSFIHAAPGGPESAIGGPMATPQQLENIREAYGLNEPLLSQYLQYLGSVLRLDFGESFTRRTPVTESIGEAAKVTVPLIMLTWILGMSAGIAMGIFTAARPGSWIDRFVLGATTVGASAPAFAVGTLFAYVFGIKLGWLPVIGAGDGGIDRLRHLILPAATAACMLLATCTKITRVRVGQIMEEDQMVFARARGLDKNWVLRNVILRNAGVQLVTTSGSLLITSIAGLIIVEQVFVLPGIGSLMMDSIRGRDIALLQGIALFVALFVVLVTLASDLLCMLIDPRLRAELKATR